MQTFLISVHVLGCAFGLGASTMLDIRVLQLLSGRIVSAEDVTVARFLAIFIRLGLAMLWLSGLCFLVRYWLFAPDLLGNAKLHAKIAIVLTLTLNGLLVEFFALPLLVKQQGRPLFEGLSRRVQAAAMIAGAISATSWYAAFALGILRELNFATPSLVILAMYGALIALACCSVVLARQALYKPHRRLDKRSTRQRVLSGT